MKLPNIPWFRVLAVIGAVGLGTNIARTVFADTPTQPRAGDRATAERKLTTPRGAEESGQPLPDGNFVAANGVVEPRDREVRVATSTAGRVLRVHVAEGASVKAGDILIELEQAAEAAAVAAAEADVNSAQAELTRAQAGSRKEDIEAARADAAATAALASSSRASLERLEPLAKAGGVSVDELDRARRRAEADQSAAAAADARARLVARGSRWEDVVVARAKLAAVQTRVEEQRVKLALRTIRAPIDGEVLSVKVRAGEHAQPGADPLVVLGDTRELRVRLDIDEREVGRVVLGALARIRAPAFPGRELTAKVVELGRRMGRKNVRTDDPVERNDTKILEVVVALERPLGSGPSLVVGQRVQGFIAATGAAP